MQYDAHNLEGSGLSTTFFSLVTHVNTPFSKPNSLWLATHSPPESLKLADMEPDLMVSSQHH